MTVMSTVIYPNLSLPGLSIRCSTGHSVDREVVRSKDVQLVQVGDVVDVVEARWVDSAVLGYVAEVLHRLGVEWEAC